MAVERNASLTATLLEEADPVIRAAIRKKLGVSLRTGDLRERNMDGLDLVAEVQLKLLAWMRKDQRAEPTNTDGWPMSADRTAIVEFKAYAATVAYHCCADYLRAKYPQRTSLRNCLRRLLETRDGYAVWMGEHGEWMCGFAGWKTGTAPAASAKLQELQQRPDALPADALPRGSAEAISGKQWLRLLEAIFDFAEGPVAMDDVLTVVSPLTGVIDVAPYEDQPREDDGSALDHTETCTADPYSTRLTVERLKLYWGAVLQLLPWHRAAYLLNVRDGDLGALPYYGVVSIEGIGQAIELEEKQIATLEQQVGVAPGARQQLGARFAACWKFLPLEDTIVALVLNVTRPQVIGYRNKARERLARSLKGIL